MWVKPEDKSLPSRDEGAIKIPQEEKAPVEASILSS